MRIYSVHSRRKGAFAEPEIVFVKEGFCWPAAIFTFVWALSRQMWFAALLLVLAQAALALVLQRLALAQQAEMAISLGFLAILGFLANDWRRASLRRRGFEMTDVVYARNMAGAEWRFLQQQEFAGGR